MITEALALLASEVVRRAAAPDLDTGNLERHPGTKGLPVCKRAAASAQVRVEPEPSRGGEQWMSRRQLTSAALTASWLPFPLATLLQCRLGRLGVRSEPKAVGGVTRLDVIPDFDLYDSYKR